MVCQRGKDLDPYQCRYPCQSHLSRWELLIGGRCTRTVLYSTLVPCFVEFFSLVDSARVAETIQKFAVEKQNDGNDLRDEQNQRNQWRIKKNQRINNNHKRINEESKKNQRRSEEESKKKLRRIKEESKKNPKSINDKSKKNRRKINK